MNGITYQAVSRAKKTEYVVGDVVQLDIINSKQAQILDLLPRTNLVYRTDNNRSKLIASNIDQILIIIAVKPNFNIQFLNNCLIFAEYSDIPPVIIINKSDLSESANFIVEIKTLYQDKLKYPVIELSALSDCHEIHALLQHKRSLLIGQSGVGKSTITNQIIPTANTRTAALAVSENSGCHTTTNAALYPIGTDASLVDCPGMQEFGLYDIPPERLHEYFPEFRALIGQCKFTNCRHLSEPGCAVTAAYAAGQIDKTRYFALQNLTEKLLHKPRN